MTKIVLKFLLLLFVPFFAQARDTDSLRVLWVGNSYTYYNDMPSTVRQIAATQKVKPQPENDRRLYSIFRQSPLE